MPIKPFRKVRCNDSDLASVQDAVEVPIRDISSRRIIDGRQIISVSLTTGADNLIQHGLGRPLAGWVLTRINAQATVWDEQDDNAIGSLTLVLRCSADCTVDLWVL